MASVGGIVETYSCLTNLPVQVFSKLMITEKPMSEVSVSFRNKVLHCEHLYWMYGSQLSFHNENLCAVADLLAVRMAALIQVRLKIMHAILRLSTVCKNFIHWHMCRRGRKLEIREDKLCLCKVVLASVHLALNRLGCFKWSRIETIAKDVGLNVLVILEQGLVHLNGWKLRCCCCLSSMIGS